MVIPTEGFVGTIFVRIFAMRTKSGIVPPWPRRIAESRFPAGGNPGILPMCPGSSALPSRISGTMPPSLGGHPP